MNWLVFSYSLPSKSKSGPRVTLWRRLNRLGAISPTSGVYVLPAREECFEAFQWLAQEIHAAKGDALVMRVERFEGLDDSELVEQFNQARARDYAELERDAVARERASAKKSAERSEIQESLDKLRRRHAEIARVDYFDCPAAAAVSARLARIAQALAPVSITAKQISPAARDAYRDKRWVTRPRPHVDRLACAWLIRRFVDPRAVIRYSAQPEPGEITFDMDKAQFGHAGNLCTFETMIAAFQLDDPALRVLSEIVHEIDLRDGRFMRPAIEGVDQILSGWQRAGFSDSELEAHGIALFEGLFNSISSTVDAAPKRKTRRR